MKLPLYSYAMVLTTGLALFAQYPKLTIKPGIYVREPAQCQGAPNASIMSWDGVGFSGPHSSQCKTTVLHKNDTTYEISDSCSALGDGSPNPGGTPFVESFVLTLLSDTRFTVARESQPKGTYRWCSRTAPNQ